MLGYGYHCQEVIHSKELIMSLICAFKVTRVTRISNDQVDQILNCPIVFEINTTCLAKLISKIVNVIQAPVYYKIV